MLGNMIAYYWEKDGKVCVQNMVGAFKGQYHEHTPEEFETWKVSAKADGIEVKAMSVGRITGF